MLLRDVAHARTGDKGDIVQIAVFPYRDADYAWLRERLTSSAVCGYLGFADGAAERYELPNLPALNFVLRRPPGENVTRTLALDVHGKCQSSLLLAMPLEQPVPKEPNDAGR
jgi:hypothetical protein